MIKLGLSLCILCSSDVYYNKYNFSKWRLEALQNELKQKFVMNNLFYSLEHFID